MTIAEVAKKFDITTDTIRYYERIGLIPPIKRDKNGNRIFTEIDCNWVYYIKVMRGAGISIEKLVEYVKLFQMGIDTIPTRKKILMEQYETLEEQINKLKSTQDILKKKIDGYEERIIAYEKNKLNTKDKLEG